MATVKFLNERGKYHDDNAIHDVLTYICQTYKTPSGLIGGIRVDPHNPAQSMVAVSEAYQKNYGVRLRHFVVSFPAGKKYTPQAIAMVAERICYRIGTMYQVVYAVHESTPDHPHFHVVFNAVSDQTGYKYHGDKEEYEALKNCIREALFYYGMGFLQVVH